MSVIIRLQNLPWSANALDIRQFFRGLSIPEGGVHIVGGELGDAFIAFSTDEDARQAFQLNNGKIKEVQIQLLLSSRTEMQKVIEAARTVPFMQAVVAPPAIPNPALIPQAPLITQSVNNSDSVKKDDKDSRSNRDDSKRRSRDRDRDRSRRRSRSRSRSRDRNRSRDRRDRRRRDRTRSRDRRDRRDRRRKSRSRDRTRSKDRDSRKGKDDIKKENRDSKVDIIENKDDTPNNNSWEVKDEPNDVKPALLPALLGNFPGPTTLEDARRSLGLITGLSQNNLPAGPINNINNRIPRNDNNGMNNQNRDNNWPRKSRFEFETNDNNMGGGLGGGIMNQFNQGNMPIRPNMNQNMNIGGMMPNIFPNPGAIRPPMPQLQDFGMSRPFLSRPGTTFPEQFSRPGPDMRNQPFGMNNDRSDESYRNDRNKSHLCVQLRPYFGGYGEVRKFFQGLYISNTGVKFVADKNKRTGIVYIKFVRPDGKLEALNRSGNMLRGVPVEVAHLDDEEWEQYGKEEPKHEDDNRNEDMIGSPCLQHFSCVVVDDLPEFAKDHDILKLFSDYTIVSVHMVVNKQFRQLAYVQFSKEDDAKSAIADKTSHVISGKPVTVCPISDDTFNEIIRQQGSGEMVIDVNYSQNDNNSPAPDNFQPNVPSHIITDCVMLSGLPQKVTDRDVLDFFSDIGIVPLRIHIMMTKFGPSGDCFCEFNNPDEAICALDKNGMPLGIGTVKVELCHRRELERAVGIPPSGGQMNQQGPRFQNRFGPRGPNLLGPRPPPNMMRRRPPAPGMRYDGPVESMGPQGCVVSMENVPFKAGVDEILDFFGNFDLSSHNVFRRFNDNGAPTGDARVTFNLPQEAHRAVEECNKLRIRDRTIYLRVLQ